MRGSGTSVRWLVAPWGMAALLVVLGNAGRASAGPPSDEADPVFVKPVEEMEHATGIAAVGDVEPVRASLVASREAGAVIEFPRREGEFVQKGEVLARMDPRVLELHVQAIEAAAEALGHELQELENGTRAETLAAAQARLRGAEEAHKLARQKLDRTERLHRQNAASVEELDEAQTMAATMAHEVDRVRAELEEATNGPRPEQIARARAEFAAKKAEVSQMRAILSLYQILAPYSGFITREHTQVGEWIERGGPVVEMIDTSEVDVRVLVPSRYSGQIPLGEEVRVEVDAISDRLLTGVVREIVPKVDLKSRLFPVKIRLYNANDADNEPILKPGMLARVQLPIGEKKKSTYVPKDALVFGQGNPNVYVIRNQDGIETAVSVPVRPGVAHDGWIEVIGDLRPGERVVTQGNERLRAGQPVRVLLQ